MCASRAIELDRMKKLENVPCDIGESKKKKYVRSYQDNVAFLFLFVNKEFQMACTVLGIVARWGAGSSTYFIEDHWFIIKKTIIFQGSRRVSTFNRVEG